MPLILFFLILSLKLSIVSGQSSCKDSMEQAPGKHYKKSIIHRFFFGNHYRKIWAQPVECPVFRMDCPEKVLRLHKTGGDLQSISLKFRDSAGKEYALKMLDKDQSKFLSPWMRKIFIGSFARDMTSALNPYAMALANRLAALIQMPSGNQELYYVAPDARYDAYLKPIKGRLAYFYLDSTRQMHRMYRRTDEFLEERFLKNAFVFDTLMYARFRLFDMLIGDFDRHRNQWVWKVTEEGTYKYVEPVAKDHDMAFSRFRDGIFPFLITRVDPEMQQYGKHYNVKSLGKTGRYMDGLLLAGFSKEAWIQLGEKMRTLLNDSSIREALKALPPPVYEMSGKDLFRQIQARRNQLPAAGEKFYKSINHRILLAGSDDPERIIIRRREDKTTEVIIYQHTSADKEVLCFRGIFRRDDTKSIKIYSLGGKDVFDIAGPDNGAIPLILYGGTQEDTYQYEPSGKAKKKKTIIADTAKGNKIADTKAFKKKLRRSSRKFYFDREGY